MRALQTLLSGAVTAVTVTAQLPFTSDRIDGTVPSDRLGYSVAGVGDVNGDGYDDVLIGTPWTDFVGPPGPKGVDFAGMVEVISGADGSVLYTKLGSAPYARLGWSVAGAGDVNGDGYADFMAGSPFESPNFARVWSGFDGSILLMIPFATPQDWPGYSVEGAGDVNGDGYDDVIVGARSNGSTSGRGTACVFSGRDGAELYAFQGDNGGDYLGYSVAGAGDLNGDGFDDVVAGIPFMDTNGISSGAIRAFSGFDGSILFTRYGDGAWDWLGISVAGIGDVNGDGYDDVVAGAREDDNSFSNAGSARVFSGVDGSTLFTVDGYSSSSYFGEAVGAAGDVNGDGVPDFIVGSEREDSGAGAQSGAARVFSGVDGSLLQTFSGEAAWDAFGNSVQGAGDLNGDGYADLIVGAEWADFGAAQGGSVYVFTSAAVGDPGHVRTFGRACGAADHVPSIRWGGVPKVGETLSIELHGGAALETAVLVLGGVSTVALDPLGLVGCSLHSTADLGFSLTTDANGQASQSIAIPADPNLALSNPYALQWIVVDPAVVPAPPGSLQLTLSDGLRVDVGL